ncbi:hypothetical protein BDZ89DRAFT_1084595 [Hymenopellis radicata]|nr:hypothetical protein BDZ89DRAFT_1084595 [Hymenopellis radicata]
MWSTISGSPSLAQTVFTFFDDVDVDSEDEEECGEPHLRRRDHFPVANAAAERVDGRALVDGQTGPHRPDWKTKIRRYFRPLRKKVYYMSLVHLLLVNFPMALIAWVSLFVLTLLGTTLLMVLPLGLLLCFIDLLFARLLSRFELHLQTKFHFPAASLRRKPPIFVRPRAQPADEETPLVQPHSNTPNLTSPHLPPVHNVLLDETSFYKNTYAMFSDPTSYHALFYFLVIKPPITLLFSLFLVVIIVPLLVVIVTAPAALRLVRRMGVWQAAVAVEGLAGEA